MFHDEALALERLDTVTLRQISSFPVPDIAETGGQAA
jgi:hypothetical protein